MQFLRTAFWVVIAVALGRQPQGPRIIGLRTQLAAVLAVVLRPQATVVEPEPTSQWNDRSHALRSPLTPGPHAWRASARS